MRELGEIEKLPFMPVPQKVVHLPCPPQVTQVFILVVQQ
jgi:hypothetical protein